jgi:sugar lactone lactonase YvrE
MLDTEAVCVWDLGAELGEGPVWDGRDRALWFTDIKRRKIHRFGPASGDRRSWDAPEQVGFVLPRRARRLRRWAAKRAASFRRGKRTLHGRSRPSIRTRRRTGSTTPQPTPSGRLWFGTMDDGDGPRAARSSGWRRAG